MSLVIVSSLVLMPFYVIFFVYIHPLIKSVICIGIFESRTLSFFKKTYFFHSLPMKFTPCSSCMTTQTPSLTFSPASFIMTFSFCKCRDLLPVYAWLRCQLLLPHTAKLVRFSTCQIFCSSIFRQR